MRLLTLLVIVTLKNELTSAQIPHQNDGWICDPHAGRRGHGNPTTDLLRHPPVASAERQRSRKDGGGRSLRELVHLAGVVRLQATKSTNAAEIVSSFSVL